MQFRFHDKIGEKEVLFVENNTQILKAVNFVLDTARELV